MARGQNDRGHESVGTVMKRFGLVLSLLLSWAACGGAGRATGPGPCGDDMIRAQSSHGPLSKIVPTIPRSMFSR